jgi:hypothetical protein
MSKLDNKLPTKWTRHQREVFRILNNAMLTNQSIFMHPKADMIPTNHWGTIAWNAAWMAAEAVENAPCNVRVRETGSEP